MIRVRGVEKSFGDKTVLHGIDAEFHAGQVNFIIGRSGSGKSVLTKCIVGLLEVDAGRVQYDDVVFSDLDRKEREAVRRRIGMLFQGGALFDSMTVLENVEFPLRMFNDMTAEERRERQRRREATGDARSRGVKTSGAESDQPLGELLASRDEVDTLSASLCAVMSGVVQASARPPEQGWRGHAD